MQATAASRNTTPAAASQANVKWVELIVRSVRPLCGLQSHFAIKRPGQKKEIIAIQTCENHCEDRIVWQLDGSTTTIDVADAPASLSISVRPISPVLAALEMARQLTADDPLTIFNDPLELHHALDREHLEWTERLWQRYKTYKQLCPKALFKKNILSARAVYPPNSDINNLLSSITWLASKHQEQRFAEHQDVTIIIPVYEKIFTTLRCIESILSERIYNYRSRVNVSIVIVDDASADGSQEQIRTLDGIGCITVICNKTNLGYLRSCNAAARNCKSEYLCFLNNDTLVGHAWLDYLVDTFKLRHDIGIVGSQLLYPNGQLQESGGVVWASGNAWNLGRGQEGTKSEYRYAREVDFVSGASLMIRQSVFQSLGGYDERYAPAYYEDIDLAFAARVNGYRVFVQPQSQVIHIEGVSHGLDESYGIKSNQKRNKEVFLNKWRDVLSQQPLESGQALALKPRGQIGAILVIDNTTPTPDQDAGSIFIFNIMLALLQMDYGVSFCPIDNLLYMPDYSPQFESLGIQVLTKSDIGSLDEYLRSNQGSYDAIIIHRPEAARMALPAIQSHMPHLPLIFYAVDLHYVRMRRHAELNHSQRLANEAQAMQELEKGILNTVDATIYVSHDELETAERELQPRSRSFMIPPVVGGKPSSASFVDRDGIVFCGSFAHAPNRDAVLWFADEVMPKLRDAQLGMVFHVVGAKPQADVLALACQDIIIHGYIEDLDQFIGQRRISVAPLRFGAGIKGKVLHTLASGLPIVASSIACEGLDLQHMKNVMLADSAVDTAQAIIELYQSSDLWHSLAKAGQEHVHAGWSMDVSMQHLHKLLKELQLPTKQHSTTGKFSLNIPKTHPFSYQNGMFKNLSKSELLAEFNL